MSRQQTILLVDPDDRARSLLATQLEPLELSVLHAPDGATARRVLKENSVRVMVTELYLPVEEAKCLVEEARRADPGREVRIIAHTHRSLDADREWALRAGADAYLIKPTRAPRVRYVVGRLLSSPAMVATPTKSGLMLRRDSLDAALADIERGRLGQSSCIVFGREWWQSLPASERVGYRSRARAVRVSLRSDSQIGNHYVEVRGRYRPDLGLATEQPESPYRR